MIFLCIHYHHIHTYPTHTQAKPFVQITLITSAQTQPTRTYNAKHLYTTHKKQIHNQKSTIANPYYTTDSKNLKLSFTKYQCFRLIRQQITYLNVYNITTVALLVKENSSACLCAVSIDILFQDMSFGLYCLFLPSWT